jgi:hypothetical protein
LESIKDIMDIDLICVEDTLETIALRGVLEWWNLNVNMHWIGSSNQLVDLLSHPHRLSTVIVLLCHGDERGLLLPELSQELEAVSRYRQSINAHEFRDFVDLPHKIVVNTGCDLGKPEYGTAFLQSGCSAYIGASGYPAGADSLFYTIHFFYEMFCQSKAIEEAHLLAQSHNEGTQMFTLYRSMVK